MLSLCCGDQVHASWVAFLCMICVENDQWCHCYSIHSPADNRQPVADPVELPTTTSSIPVPLATPTRELESSEEEQTRSTLSSRDSLSQRTLSIRPNSPAHSAQTSTVAPASRTHRAQLPKNFTASPLHPPTYLHLHRVHTTTEVS